MTYFLAVVGIAWLLGAINEVITNGEGNCSKLEVRQAVSQGGTCSR